MEVLPRGSPKHTRLDTYPSAADSPQKVVKRLSRVYAKGAGSSGGDGVELTPTDVDPNIDAVRTNLGQKLDEAWDKPTKEIRMNTIVTTCSLVLALITLLNASTKSETSHLVLAALAVLMVGITSVYVTFEIYTKTDRTELFSICAPLVIAILSVISFLCFYNW